MLTKMDALTLFAHHSYRHIHGWNVVKCGQVTFSDEKQMEDLNALHNKIMSLVKVILTDEEKDEQFVEHTAIQEMKDYIDQYAALAPISPLSYAKPA